MGGIEEKGHVRVDQCMDFASGTRNVCLIDSLNLFFNTVQNSLTDALVVIYVLDSQDQRVLQR